MKTPRPNFRAKAYERDSYPWHVGLVPDRFELDGKSIPHPVRTNAIFVVHGMGTQTFAETGGRLRSGFEDALPQIQKWEHAHHLSSPIARGGIVPPPYIKEGFWANYASLKKTFPGDWEKFEPEIRRFFSRLWRYRTLSLPRTFLWFLKHLLKLLSPRVLWEVGPIAWLMYIPLQIVALAVLVALLIRYPKIISGYLADIRLYLDPKGITEDVIVQNIDYRVGETFMRMLGLDLNFRPLTEAKRLTVQGVPFTFTRIIWVAHSLGTVISYNVVSDLFTRADELERTGDAKQKKGVAMFRTGFRRFITLGSPLDKVAFLFGEDALRPWPRKDRSTLLEGGDNPEPGEKEWWINFYHVLDPVSGALSHPMICGKDPPSNLHMDLLKIPGFAHEQYWSDTTVLRYILGRVYGKELLPDRDYHPYRAWVLTIASAAGYLVWAAIIVGSLVALYRCLPYLLKLL